MDRTFSPFAAIPFLIAIGFAGCSVSEPTIPISEETSYSAREVGFPYEKMVTKAEQGDKDALEALLRFNEVDGAGALGHGMVLVQLGSLIGDKPLSDVTKGLPIGVRKKVKRYLEFGVAYSTDSDQQRPLSDQFPRTVEVLVGE